MEGRRCENELSFMQHWRIAYESHYLCNSLCLSILTPISLILSSTSSTPPPFFILLISTNNLSTLVLIKDLGSVFLHEIKKRRRQFLDNFSYITFIHGFVPGLPETCEKGAICEQGGRTVPGPRMQLSFMMHPSPYSLKHTNRDYNRATIAYPNTITNPECFNHTMRPDDCIFTYRYTR